MSPTLFRQRGYRFYFLSREEPRAHVHVYHPDVEAKFWMDSEIALARNQGLSAQALLEIEIMIREHEKEIRDAWRRHFPG
ncbi:uncharacterized protein DUF4160 [Methylosinus sp. sav-2]|uniref:DUF4160 domain-containing protein n=1 Tax=Methylosinus sp. sav-2 TaxID=2485168 RepID=UPI00047E6DDF|nr:DUF4160 domain-containing protein [Methylosinus sp. sav-2]TDX67420.1 uncharacterized protein DUF4160 [Methylosinus sp. sav-2]